MSGASLNGFPAHRSDWLGLTLHLSKQDEHPRSTAAPSQFSHSPQNIPQQILQTPGTSRPWTTDTQYFPTSCCTALPKGGSTHQPCPSVMWKSQLSFWCGFGSLQAMPRSKPMLMFSPHGVSTQCRQTMRALWQQRLGWQWDGLAGEPEFSPSETSHGHNWKQALSNRQY